MRPAGPGRAHLEGDGVDEGVVVEGGQVGILHLDVHDLGVVVHAQPHLARPVVVEVRERHLRMGHGL